MRRNSKHFTLLMITCAGSQGKSVSNDNVLFLICFVNALSASVFQMSCAFATFSSFHPSHQLFFTSFPYMKRPLYFIFEPSARTPATAKSDITLQISCIRYPAWISDSRNNFCQLNWISDENCQVVEIINAFVSSKYLLLSSFLQLY